MAALEWMKLQALHMHNKRRIIEIKWYDFINDEVAEVTGLYATSEILGYKPEADPVIWSRRSSTTRRSCLISAICMMGSRGWCFLVPDWQRRCVGLALRRSIRFVQTPIFRLRTLFYWHKTVLHGEQSQRPLGSANDDDDDDVRDDVTGLVVGGHSSDDRMYSQ